MRSTESPEEGGNPLEERPLAPEEPATDDRPPLTHVPPSAAAGDALRPSTQWPPRDVVLRRLVTPRTLVVTPLLIAANVAVHFYALTAAEGGLDAVVREFGQTRFAVWGGEYYRLLTAIFLHGNLPHLLLNMVVLAMLGRIGERVLGAGAYLITYLLCGLGGSLLFQAVAVGTGTGVGASGAVYGLVGILLWVRFGRTATGAFQLTKRLVFWTVFLVGLDQAFTFVVEWTLQESFRIATSAHLGGLASGLFLGYFGLSGIEKARHPRRARYGALASCGVLFGALGAYGCVFPYLDPVWPVWQGLQAHERGDTERARALYDEAIEQAGDEAGSLATVIISLELQEERYDEAVRLWRLHPDKRSPERLLEGWELFESLTLAGESSLAQRVLDELITSTEAMLAESADLDLHNQLAWLFALRGVRLPEALDHAKLAVKLMESAGGDSWFSLRRDLTLAAYRNTLGWVQFLLGDDESALRNLNLAAELSPRDGLYLVYVARAHWELGNQREAREVALEARKLGVRPSSIEALQLKNLLVELGEETSD